MRSPSSNTSDKVLKQLDSVNAYVLFSGARHFGLPTKNTYVILQSGLMNLALRFLQLLSAPKALNSFYKCDSSKFSNHRHGALDTVIRSRHSLLD